MEGKKKQAPKGSPENHNYYTENEIIYQARILYILKRYGRQTRQELRSWTGLSDRDVRKTIEALRRRGIWALSGSHTKGYWISDDEAEFLAFKAEMLSRCGKILSMIKAMEEAHNVQR